tara:strand:- start:615 stop:1442 length:828 start_codon:yes stop_codon:yes gene_type:complete
MKKKCIITGSNGYLGSHLVSKFKNLGWEVLELSSSNSNNQIQFKLNEIDHIKKEIFENCNLLVHTSYDFKIKEKKLDKNLNITGSLKLFEKARDMNVEKIINISTISAFKNSKSIYGRTKFRIEEDSKIYNVINLRPGLFFGSNSKIIKKIEKICNIFPIVPMIGKGNFNLHLTNYDDLFNFILEVYNDDRVDYSKILYPCTRDSITFKNLIKIISNNKAILPVPLFFIVPILKIFDVLKINLPLDLDNLYGLINYSDEINFQQTKKYKTNFRNL